MGVEVRILEKTGNRYIPTALIEGVCDRVSNDCVQVLLSLLTARALLQRMVQQCILGLAN